MSNLLKSKFLLGLMIVAIFFVGVALVTPKTTLAASCTITKTLKMGMKGTEVTCLQQQLNVTPATGYFGALTKAAVIAFQKNHSLPATGLFGSLSRAALAGTSPVGTTYPAGCTSTSGFSSTTGLPCSGATTTFPAGCTSATGFSSTTGLPCSSTTPPVTSGPLSVSLATDNPAAGTVVAGQATADLAHFAFTGTGTISSITLSKNGISDQNTLSNVYLFDGAQRLTDGYSFNNSGSLTINGLNVAVSGTKTLSVKADVASGTLSYSIGVTLTGYAVTGGTTNAVSVAGNVMYVASAPSNLGAAVFNGNNGVAASSVNPGTTGYPIWSAPLQINNRNLSLKMINFRVIGSAPADSLANVKLFLDGTAVGSNGVTTVINGSNYWSFDLSAAPVTLTTGSHTLDLRADIVKGSSFSFTASLQLASDMTLFDSQVGVNVAATGITTAHTTAGLIQISTGSVSVTVDPTFQANTTVTGGATNVDIAKFKLHAYGEDVKMDALNFLPYVNPANGLQNVTAYFNGSQVGTQDAVWANADGAEALTPGSQMIVPAGVDSFLEIKADLRTTGSVNYTTGTTYATFQSSTGEGMNSKQTFTVANGGVQGNSLTIQTGVVALATNTGFVSQVVSPNTPNQKIASFVIQNQSSSEAVHVTNLQLTLALTTADSTNYSNLKTSETSGQGATPINPATAAAGGNSVNNFPVDFQIAAGTTKTIDVFADVGSTAGNATVITKLYVTALGSSSNVTLCSTGITTGSMNGCNTGTPATGQTITVATGTFGTPTVSTTGTTTGQYIAGGTVSPGVTNAATAEFKFTATNGNATITELRFSDDVVGAYGASNKGAVTSVAVGSVSAPTFAGVASLTGLSIPVLQGGAGITIDAKMSYSPVGSTGVATITTGDITSLMKLSYVKYTMGGSTYTLCAASTGTTCNATTGMPVTSNQTMTLVGSKPTVTVGTPTGVSIAAGQYSEAIDVTIAADTAGPLTMISFPINVSLTGAGSTGTLAVATGGGNLVIVKDANNNTAGLSATGNFISGTAGTITVTLNSTTGYLLSAGQSQTFRVYIPIASITSGGSATWYNRITSNLATGVGFVWADTAGGAANSSGDITSEIYNYPSTQSVVVQQ